jgi:nucleotide-binding universal stress UspA family protein
MTHVMACIDGSRASKAVCDYAAWASQRLEAQLTFLHVLDRTGYTSTANLSGSIGLGAQEALLEELAALDEQRSRLALQQGRLMLEAAVERAINDGVKAPMMRQRHGDLVETLAELENDIRLLVIGRQGEDGDQVGQHLGGHVERVIRTLHRPILITQQQYQAPSRIMLGFDASATTRKGVEMLAASPLFRGLPCHVVLVGADTDDHRAQLEWARKTLETAGHDAVIAIVAGEVETALREYQLKEQIDLMVIGAYGHSRIRQFFVGSTTNHMIMNAQVPLLVLR